MTDQPRAFERRRHLRIAPKGTVILHVGDHAQRGRISNLSHGGLLLATSVTAPDRLLGRAAKLELRLDGQLAEWLRALGRILRIHPEGVAIAFETVPAMLIRMIDDMSSESRAHLRVVSVFVIDGETERRDRMVAGFRDAGCVVVEAATPLEAIVKLGESSFEPDLIAIADTVPAMHAADLRTFVERDHPRAKLVTIGNDAMEPVGLSHWLSSVDPGSDLPTRVRHVLGRPRRS